MSILSRCLVLAVGVAVAFQALAAAPTPVQKTRVEIVSLRVTVDAAGKVQTSRPSDPQTAPGLLAVAEAFARKLAFTPARKQGVAVPGETTLTLVIALEPRADGQYGPHLRRATNGPGVLEVGRTVAPKYQQGKENGALVGVAVSLLADGSTDMGTLATERMELRVPSAFAEARYLDAVKTSLRETRFDLDKVDGVAIPAAAPASPTASAAGRSSPSRATRSAGKLEAARGCRSAGADRRVLRARHRACQGGLHRAREGGGRAGQVSYMFW